jgi:3D (Asp-Asp-Asp) domain-containing protein
MKIYLLFTGLLLANLSCSHSENNIFAVRTTSYTHNESDHLKYGRKTAIGTELKTGTAAADWSIFPVGTILNIAGERFEISDYGSALVKTKGEIPVIDIYKKSFAEMNKWGVKFLDIEVLKWGDFERSKEILSGRLKYKHCREMHERL